jgi:hypothetical protein
MFFCTFPFTPGLCIPYDAVVNARPSLLAAVTRKTKTQHRENKIFEKGAIWQQQK